MPKKSHQLQISPVQNTVISERGMRNCYTLMSKVRVTRTERNGVGTWMFINVTDRLLPARTDYSQTQLFARRKLVPSLFLLPRKTTGHKSVFNN